VPAQEMRVIFHPTRARILEMLKGNGPAARTSLAERAGVPLASVGYHCRALLRSRCICFAPSFSLDSENPVYEVVR
jgi:DNA-binding transcriptional ArsR family regulator